MSVLSNSTNITFYNDTNHFIEVSFSGEQNCNLTIFHNNANVITRDTNSIVNYLYSLVAGKESKLVHVNIPLKNKTTMTVKCNAHLHFFVTPKISTAKEVEKGSFLLSTEYQNNDLEIKFTETYGVGYDVNGDVCINIMQPIERDLVINSTIFVNKKPINLKTQEAFCKIRCPE